MNVIFIFLWGCLLIPTISDSHFTLEITGYSVRLSYIALVIAFLIFSYPLIIKQSNKVNFNQVALDKLTSQKFYVFFILLLIVGLLSILFSPIKSISNREHAFIYWMWTGGTILTLPYIFIMLEHKTRRWIYLLFFFYYLASVGMLMWDSVFVHLNKDLLLGNFSGGGSGVVRPHLFKKEPGYFAAYWSLALIYIRQLKNNQHDPNIGKLLKFFYTYTWLWYALGMLCLVLVLSKMGIVVVGFLLLTEGFYRMFSHHSSVVKRWIYSVLTYSMLALAFIYYFLIPTHPGDDVNAIMRYPLYIKHHLIQYAVSDLNQFFTPELFDVKRVRKLSNMRFSQARFRRAEAGFKIFLRESLLGVGTGLAAYYYKQHYPSPPNPSLTPKKKPISHNLYTELLSEWGIIGFLLFFIGIYFLFNRAPLLTKIHIYGTLAIIYTTAETLPRFDLWLYLIMLWHLLIYKKHLAQ